MKNSYKLWIVFSLIFVFAAGVVGGILLKDHVLEKRPTLRESRKPQHRFPTLDFLAEELGLSQEQQESIREIFRRNEERLRELRSRVREEFASLRSRLKQEMDAVFTEEQRTKFEAMVQKYISERKKREEGRKEKPGKKDAPRPEDKGGKR